MRIRFRWFRLAAAGCLLLLLSAIGSGQSKMHAGIINAPFEFDVGGANLPAGQYILGVYSAIYAQLKSADGKTNRTLYFTASGEPEKSPRAVFVLRNKKYFFSGVNGWFGRMQYTGFSPHAGDETKEVPITSAE